MYVVVLYIFSLTSDCLSFPQTVQPSRSQQGHHFQHSGVPRATVIRFSIHH